MYKSHHQLGYRCLLLWHPRVSYRRRRRRRGGLSTLFTAAMITATAETSTQQDDDYCYGNENADEGCYAQVPDLIGFVFHIFNCGEKKEKREKTRVNSVFCVECDINV